MRIVHFSDIHFSDKNFEIFGDTFRDALLEVLLREHEDKKIDIIVITGDLVDQGGHSLLELEKFSDQKDPYVVFEQIFIDPIKEALKLENKNFLFIPGNHDIDENEILWVDEKFLKSVEAKGEINSLLAETRDKSHEKYSHRIKLFKDFEERFHKEDSETAYKFTRNQSTYTYDFDGINVGFALINDSWRCSTCILHQYHDKKLYFGYKQLRESLQLLKGTTAMNIILTHHPIEKYEEIEHVKEILTHQDFHLHLYGDQHHHELHPLISSSGGCFGIMSRPLLNKPHEAESWWQSGFNIIDINLNKAIIDCITYYKYYKRGKFDTDNELANGGKDISKHKLHFKPVEKEEATDQDDDLTLQNYLKK